jgi:hypothetical protein
MRTLMRCLFLVLGMLGLLAAGLARAQDVAQEFSGTGETTTAMFTVGDRWEVRWNARQAISVAAMSSNGTLVAGASGVLRGSLFVPAGGQYYLKITDGTVAIPAPAPSTNAPPASTNSVPEPVSVVPLPADQGPGVSWHLQVMQLAQTVSSTDSLTVYAPYFSVPDSAITEPAAPPPPPSPILSPDQVSSLVTIKGDNISGSGFFLRATEGVYVVAHLKLVADNPNLQITTLAGAPVKIHSMKAASDRNLVLIAVQDDNFKCLTEPTGTDTPAALGDYVIVPVLGQSDLTAARVGHVINLGPQRVDFDGGVRVTSNSAPVIHVATGKVLGIVTTEKGVDLTQTTAKAWQDNPMPGEESLAPYFGLLLTNVPGWEPLDLTKFDSETAMLKDFHNTTRCLDSYLNGYRRLPQEPAAAPYGAPDSRSYKSNARIVAAHETFRRQATETDSNDAVSDQTIDATRELLDDLQTIAQSNVDQLQAMTPLYSINRRRVKEELAYRHSLQVELNGFGDDISRLSKIARSR